MGEESLTGTGIYHRFLVSLFLIALSRVLRFQLGTGIVVYGPSVCKILVLIGFHF